MGCAEVSPVRSGERNSPERGHCKDVGHGVAVGYGALREEQEGQCGRGLVSKVGADGHELAETERGRIIGHGDEFALILHAMEV